MNTIWKFTLRAADVQRVDTPGGAEILCTAEQHGQVCIWALVDPELPPEPRTFAVYGTGHDVRHSDGKYIGSVQLHSGALVFHVFEVKG